MKNIEWLQMFAEGEGGDTSASTEPTTEVTQEAPSGEMDSSAQVDSIMARLPERAKGAFKEAYKETHKPAPVVAEEPQPEPAPAHVPYSDLIKSDEYKAEHKAYMDKTISERFKGTEAKMSKMQKALNIVAQKYGLDTSAEDFLDNISQKVESDNSYLEDYAMQHDMSVEEARRNIELEQKVKTLEAQEQARQQEARNAEAMKQLMANADRTKQMFPNFDLDTEMQNEQFRRLLFATGGDTTAAYQALHWNEIIPQKVAIETAKVKQALTNSIATGQKRPMESGMSNSPAAVVNAEPNYEGMSAKQMREFAMKNFRKR